MGSKTYELDAIIRKVPSIGGTYVKFLYNVKTEFRKGRARVHATSDGIPYDGSVVNMDIENADGSVCYIIDLRKDIHTKIGEQSGDSVHIIIQERN